MSYVIINKQSSPYKGQIAEVVEIITQTKVKINDRWFFVPLSDIQVSGDVLYFASGPHKGLRVGNKTPNENFEINVRKYRVRIHTMSGYVYETFDEDDISEFNDDANIDNINDNGDIDDDVNNSDDYVDYNQDDEYDEISSIYEPSYDMRKLKENITGWNEEHKVLNENLPQHEKIIAIYIKELLKLLNYSDKFIEDSYLILFNGVFNFIKNTLFNIPFLGIRFDTQSIVNIIAINKIKTLCLAVIYVYINFNCYLPIDNNYDIFSIEYISNIINNTNYISNFSITEFNRFIIFFYYSTTPNATKSDIQSILRLTRNLQNTQIIIDGFKCTKPNINNISNMERIRRIDNSPTTVYRQPIKNDSRPYKYARTTPISRYSKEQLIDLANRYPKMIRPEIMKKIHKKIQNDPTARIIQKTPTGPIFRGRNVTSNTWFTPGLYNNGQAETFQTERARLEREINKLKNEKKKLEKSMMTPEITSEILKLEGEIDESKIKDKVLREIYSKYGTYFSLEDIYNIIKNVLDTNDTTTKNDIIALLGFDVNDIQKSLITKMIKDIKNLINYYILKMEEIKTKESRFTNINKIKKNIRNEVIILTLNIIRGENNRIISDDIKDEIKRIISLFEIGYTDDKIVQDTIVTDIRVIRNNLIQTYLPLFRNIIERNRLTGVSQLSDDFDRISIGESSKSQNQGILSAHQLFDLADQTRQSDQQSIDLSSQLGQLNLNGVSSNPQNQGESSNSQNINNGNRGTDIEIQAKQIILKDINLINRMVKNKASDQDIYNIIIGSTINNIQNNYDTTTSDNLRQFIDDVILQLRNVSYSNIEKVSLSMEIKTFIISNMRRLYLENHLDLPNWNDMDINDVDEKMKEAIARDNNRLNIGRKRRVINMEED